LPAAQTAAETSFPGIQASEALAARRYNLQEESHVDLRTLNDQQRTL
jgi:hypothetical protein